MTDFYKDLFVGSGSLSGRTPDTGVTPTAPAVDLDDQGAAPYNQAGGNNFLSALVLDGAGAVQFDKSVETSKYGVMKLSGMNGPDCTMEVVWRGSPMTQSLNIVLAARASTMVTGAWADAVNWTGAYFSFGGADYVAISEGEATDGVWGTNGYITASNYPAGPYDITLRLEVIGNVKRISVDDVVIATTAITDPNFVAASDCYIGVDAVYADSNGNFTGNLSDVKLLSFRAFGPPPAVSVAFNTLRPRIFAPG